MFFLNLPRINYNNENIVDISRRMYIPDNVRNQAGVYDMYTVTDGERIEDVAFEIYGDPGYHWVIILMNDIIDPFYDWVLSDVELNKYIDANYPGVGNAKNSPNGVHHWRIGNQDYTYNAPGSVTITNKTHEQELNEKKREIKLLRKEYLSRIEYELAQGDKNGR